MSMVRVYRFRGFDVVGGTAVQSRRLATKEAIEASPELEIMPIPYWVVDEAVLDGNGMTRPMDGAGSVAYGALDDEGNAYLVFEKVVDDPAPTREAFKLLPSDTLIHAEQTATEYNRHGSMIVRGGPPLTGSQIPRLHVPPSD